MSQFERVLGVSKEELEFVFRGQLAPWTDFLLNPRRLRGSDFLMRWSQGVWSEERLVQAVNDTGAYVALPYGPSGTAPDNDVRAFELYFERLEKAGLGNIKRPDLLIFPSSDSRHVERIIARVGGIQELPFTPEEDLKELLSLAILAVECENSLWKASQMPDYGKELKPQRWMSNRPGMKKTAILPTIILKEEDRKPLSDWQQATGIPVHIWHVFYDIAFGISFEKAEDIIEAGLIQGTEQIFQAPSGATTRKIIYKIYYQYGYPLGYTREEPKLMADYVIDRNGHILPYVRFVGGNMSLSPDALQVLNDAAQARGGKE